MMKIFLHCLILCSLLGSPSIRAASAAQTILPPTLEKTLKNARIKPAEFSVATIPLTSTDGGIYFNADIPVNPASTMKLLTTYAALELLGPEYQWRTEIYADGPIRNGVLEGNLYIRGGGDPKLNIERLWLLLRDLRLHGVRQITGDLVLDRSYFIQPDSPVFEDDGHDPYRPFLVQPDSLLVNFKAIRFLALNDEGDIQIAMDPPLYGIQIENRIQSLQPAPCTAWPDIHYSPNADVTGIRITVTGRLPQGCTAQTYLSLLDHPEYTANTVRAIWSELGGSIFGKSRMAPLPDDARLIVHTLSPDLAEVIRDINKYSNNTMAQQLLLSIGAVYRKNTDQDDIAAARRTIQEWLNSKGIQTAQLTLENGSGLSRTERITVRTLAEILQAAWHSPYSAEFISSMPLVAKDGTMSQRLENTPVAGRAHIKTGTLKNVRAIAGYSRDARGQIWAIVAVVNSPTPWSATTVLDQVLLDLY